MPSCGGCVCVCMFVTFVDHVKTNKDIFEIFSPSGSYIILVFVGQTAQQYSDGNPLDGSVECRWGRQKSRFWACLALVPAVSAATCQVLSTGSPVDDPPSRKLWHIAGRISGCADCGRRRRNVYDKKPWRYAKDNRTAHLTARSDKSVAYVTNNERLYSTFCSVETNYGQIRSIERPLCDSRATCFHTEQDGNIPTGTSLTRVSNTTGYENITIYLALSQKWCKIEP